MDELKTVSAYHNYLVRGRLQEEVFVRSKGEFFFQAHRLRPEETVPLVSGAFFNRKGELLVRMERNELLENPQGLALVPMKDGWSLISWDMSAVLSCQVLQVGRGLVTIFRGVLYDDEGLEVIKGGELGLEFPRHVAISDGEGEELIQLDVGFPEGNLPSSSWQSPLEI